jgi:hypothetical protein
LCATSRGCAGLCTSRVVFLGFVRIGANLRALVHTCARLCASFFGLCARLRKLAHECERPCAMRVRLCRRVCATVHDCAWRCRLARACARLGARVHTCALRVSGFVRNFGDYARRCTSGFGLCARCCASRGSLFTQSASSFRLAREFARLCATAQRRVLGFMCSLARLGTLVQPCARL